MAAAPCGWTIITCGCGACWDTYSPAVQERAAALAAMQMWAATGRRYGLCTITVQPCRPRPDLPLYQVYPVLWDGWGTGGGIVAPYINEGGQWANGCWGGCRCVARCEVPLEGPTTTAAVGDILVDGVLVPTDAYQIQNGNLLVRIDGQCWPTCNDYSKQDPATFVVTYGRGEPIPPAVQGAFEILACEYAKACTGGKCRLPRRLQSLTRQGVDLQVVPTHDYWDRMMTNITEVDAVIVADNPHRLSQRPQIFSPDMPPPRMVT